MATGVRCSVSPGRRPARGPNRSASRSSLSNARARYSLHAHTHRDTETQTHTCIHTHTPEHESTHRHARHQHTPHIRTHKTENSFFLSISHAHTLTHMHTHVRTRTHIILQRRRIERSGARTPDARPTNSFSLSCSFLNKFWKLRHPSEYLVSQINTSFDSMCFSYRSRENQNSLFFNHVTLLCFFQQTTCTRPGTVCRTTRAVACPFCLGPSFANSCTCIVQFSPSCVPASPGKNRCGGTVRLPAPGETPVYLAISVTVFTHVQDAPCCQKKLSIKRGGASYTRIYEFSFFRYEYPKTWPILGCVLHGCDLYMGGYGILKLSMYSPSK